MVNNKCDQLLFTKKYDQLWSTTMCSAIICNVSSYDLQQMRQAFFFFLTFRFTVDEFNLKKIIF